MTTTTDQWTPDVTARPAPATAVTAGESLKSLTSLATLDCPPATSVDGTDEAVGGPVDETAETLAAPWPVAVGHRLAGWGPVVAEPAEPAAVARYAAEAPWCAPWALGWRRAGMAYTYLIALPATSAAHSAAWLAQWAGGIDTGWLPTGRASEGRRARWLVARPPSLGELAATTTVVAGRRRTAALAAVAVSAVAYGLAWLFQRPGRLTAAVLLAAVIWFA